MFYLRIISLLVIIALNANLVSAFETDQYNLPDKPLADIGDEITDYAYANIVDAVATLNAKIEKIEGCLSGRDECDTKDKAKLRQELDHLKSEDAIALEVFRTMGAGGLMFTKASSYVEKHDFSIAPARYKTSYPGSVYMTVPTNYLTISSTIKAYGHEFGTDKIAHFFQQGYDYYKIYRKQLQKDRSEKAAMMKAVKWGKLTEATYFGNLVSGVYSNGDLAANYAGMKFYIGLTQETVIGSEVRPPITALDNDRWKVDPLFDKYASLLKPYFSDHFNEALNPSVYILGLRSIVRISVKNKSCHQWLENFPEKKQADYEAIFSEMKLWNGEKYGFKQTSKPLTISELCF